MRANFNLGSLLFCLVALMLWQPTEASAQTGNVRGEVKVCSLDSNGKPQNESTADVTVYMVKKRLYNSKTFSFDWCRKNHPDCDSAETEDDGSFTKKGLLSEKWVFFAYKEDYGLSNTATKFIVKNKTHEVKPSAPPPPPFRIRKWEKAKCTDESARIFRFNAGLQTDTLASNSEAESSQGAILLVLYQENPQKKQEEKTLPQPIVLEGQVVDIQRLPLSSATVTVSDITRGTNSAQQPAMETQVTDKDGRFKIELIKSPEGGAYLFSVVLDGFESYIVTLDEARAALTKPGKDEATITLAREDELSEQREPLLETLEATRRHVFRPDVMQTLPLRGTRSFDEFALLAPGVLPPPETFGKVGPGVSSGVGTAGQFSVNGLRSRENNFTIDGSDNNDENIGTRRQGFIMTVPQPVESIYEVQVITALADTQFGRNIGGQIDALTKTGGPGLHGSLYSFVTDDLFNARAPFDQTTRDAPPSFTPRRAIDRAPVLLDGSPLVLQNPVGGEDRFRRSQIGLAAGGQLKRYGNTSFFVSAERQDIRASKESHFAVPTISQRGVFNTGETGLLLAPIAIVTRTLSPASIPGNAIFSLYPFPNNPRGPYSENTYSSVLPADGHGTRFSVKLDHRFGGDSPKKNWWTTIFTPYAHIDNVTVRYNVTDELSTLPVTGGALFSALRPRVRTHNLAFFFNRSLSPTVSDTIRFSFGRTRLVFGERRDASQLRSSALPGTRFLMNAPLLLNVTTPNADGSLNAPSFITASGAQGTALLNSLGYVGVTQTEQITGPLGQVNIAGFSPIGVDVENFPQDRDNNTFQIADTVTSVHENDIFTFGVDVRKTHINSRLDRNFRPHAVFNGLPSAPAGLVDPLVGPGGISLGTGTFDGTTMAAAGVPTGLFQALAVNPDSFIGIRFTQVNFFLQDQRRVHPRLHLTLGVRYEVNTVPDTVDDRLENAFDPNVLRTQAAQAVNFCNSPRCSDLVSALTAAFPADFKASFGPDNDDFDIRFGVAWSPQGLEATSLRGGVGIYSGQFPGIVIDQTRNAFSNFLPLNMANFSPRSGNRTFLFNIANPAVRELSPALHVITPGTLNEFPSINPIALLANQFFGLGNLSLSPSVLGLDLVVPQKKLKAPYALHYGLTLEHQFGGDFLASIAYVGTTGVKLLRIATPDRGLNFSRFGGPLDVDPLTQAAPFPFFQGQVLPPQSNIISNSFTIARTFFESSGHSTYNSLQVELRKRYGKGRLMFGSAFTYSHSIDDASDFMDTAGAFALPQNSLRRSERASSNFDVRLRWVTHFVWNLPQPRRKLVGLLGGLQAAGIITTQSGQPYTVNSAVDINRDGNLTDRLNTMTGLFRGPVGGDRRIQLSLAPGVSASNLLAPDGLDGAIGRNTFRAPSLFTCDVSLTKTVSLRGNSQMLLRTEVFNLFNRANYGVPVRILESPAFGKSVTTLVPARTIQFALKYQF